MIDFLLTAGVRVAVLYALCHTLLLPLTLLAHAPALPVDDDAGGADVLLPVGRPLASTEASGTVLLGDTLALFERAFAVHAPFSRTSVLRCLFALVCAFACSIVLLVCCCFECFVVVVLCICLLVMIVSFELTLDAPQ